MATIPNYSQAQTKTGRYAVNLVSARKAWAGEADITYLHIKYINWTPAVNRQPGFRQEDL